MIVTILEGENNKILQQADLALCETDMKTVSGQRIYEVVKNRYAPNGRYILEGDIRDFVRNYERKEQERRGDQPTGDFEEIFQR